MTKKIIMAGMAIAAFAAFVAPSVASALPVVTHPTGTPMAIHPAGTTCTAEPKGCILGTQLGASTMRSAANETESTVLVECSKATLTGELTTNSAAAGIAGTITSAKFTGTEAEEKCKSILGPARITTEGFATGIPWCIKAAKAEDTMEVRGGKCSEASRALTFIVDAGGLECKYSRSNVTGTFRTDKEPNEDLIVTLTNSGPFEREANVLCPEKGFLNMSFTLETDSSTVEPLFAS